MVCRRFGHGPIISPGPTTPHLPDTYQEDEGGWALGWILSDAVRCDSAYRHRVTGGGVQGAGGRYQGRGPGGASIDRQRWTTTLRPEAMAILRGMAEREHLDRNEIIERLLFAAAAGELQPTAELPGGRLLINSRRRD